MNKPRKRGKRKPKPISEYVTEQEYVGLLEATTGIHHKVGMMFGFECGLRISEAINLQPNDIDVVNKRMKIRQGKGGKDRYVPLPYSWQDKHLQYIPIACSKRALQKAFEIAAEKSGLYKKKPKVHFHSLRHGFATNCMNMGMEIPEIQLLMGHEDIQTTMIYVKMNPINALRSFQEKVAQDG